MARGRRLLSRERDQRAVDDGIDFKDVKPVADALGSMTTSWTEVVDVVEARGRRDTVVTSWTRG